MTKLICIYCITSPTNRKYVGQTWDLHSRYKSGVSKSQRLLYRSIEKYGKDAHTKEILHVFDEIATQADLDEKEIYFIELLKSQGFNMLNIREGGGNSGALAKETKEILRDKKTQWAKDNPEKAKACSAAGARGNIGLKRSAETRAAQSAAAKGKEKSESHRAALSASKTGKPTGRKGIKLIGDALENIRKGVKRRTGLNKAITQYDLQGNKIQDWPSIKIASETLHIHKGTIGGCIRGYENYKTAGGFIWRFKTDTSPIDTQTHVQTYNPKKCPVIQLGMDGIKIAEFDTVKEAGEKTGVHRTMIIAVCRGRAKSAGGYHWRYKPLPLPGRV